MTVLGFFRLLAVYGVAKNTIVCLLTCTKRLMVGIHERLGSLFLLSTDVGIQYGRTLGNSKDTDAKGESGAIVTDKFMSVADLINQK